MVVISLKSIDIPISIFLEYLEERFHLISERSLIFRCGCVDVLNSNSKSKYNTYILTYTLIVEKGGV